MVSINSLMIYFQQPPSRDRFVAEVRNILRFRTRPVCILGKPRASAKELCLALGGERLSRGSFWSGGSLVIVEDDCTVIY